MSKSHIFHLIFTFVATLLMALRGANTVEAQSGWAYPGAIANLDGDLYHYEPGSNALTQLTTWGHNSVPVQSPDWRYIAYSSVAEEAVNDTNPGATNTINIYLLDRATGVFTRIADQSAGTTYRSFPAWNPDSNKLVWQEVIGEYRGVSRIVVYDLATGTQSVIRNDFDPGFMDGGLYLSELEWGIGGLLYMRFPLMLGNGGGTIYIEIINPNTGAITSYPVGDFSDRHLIIYEAFWVDRWVVTFTHTGLWHALDTTNGSYNPLPGSPSLVVSDGIGALSLTPSPLTVNNGIRFQWIAGYLGADGVTMQAETLPYETYTLMGIEMPAMGNGIIWNDEGTLQRWQPGASLTPIMTASWGHGVVWQGTEWKFNAPNPTTPPVLTPQATASSCNTPPRVAIGTNVIVNPGVPNNLRAHATLNSRVLGVLPAGTRFAIVGGPICADGYYWWEGQGAGWRGWTAEGINGDYWLQVTN